MPYGRVERRDEVAAWIGLAEKPGAPVGKRLPSAGDAVMGGNKDDGRRFALSDEHCLEIEAGHPAQVDIQDQAIEGLGFPVREECLSARLAGGFHTHRAQQAAK
jgi:hypothetical protein